MKPRFNPLKKYLKNLILNNSVLENICNQDYSEIENDKNLCKIWLEAIWEFPKFPKVRIIIILSFYTKLIKLKALSLKIRSLE